ncbi:uncharacterized protein JN550_002802 [Neoarthrinium moseri]|uniref:uncharacterized protein n=1 Tax=Neoarthrinium moseri TaxID=1658444 RepID=UPI001FDCA8E8|nr:uncharacterized protein JN550_002802 [Neoarthrinium moseri]KAI1874223.1 hypothetical protein JN550_002802 [Neoarthrinium moseri]
MGQESQAGAWDGRHPTHQISEEAEFKSEIIDSALPQLDYGDSSSFHDTVGMPLTDSLGGISTWPSQLQSSAQTMVQPPSHLYSETMPLVDPTYEDPEYTMVFPVPTNSDHSFAAQANELINASLGRTPDGNSVVDPDSVLGDSGRLYHGYKSGKYFLPNDAAEQDRLDLQHHMFTLMLDGWFGLAPMTTVPAFVLDVATGTGIWALEFAERFPSSFVIGTDLSAIQPDPRVPNCVFQKDDSEAEWVFPAPHPQGINCTLPCEHRIMFDYVHLRMVCTCFDDPRTVMKSAFDNMSPGGWIEFQDATFDITADDANWEGSPLDQWCKGCVQGAANSGRDILVPRNYKQWLEETGFVDVQQRPFVLPCNPWPKDKKLKEVGLWQLKNMMDGVRSTGWKMLSQAGYTPAGIESLIKETQEYLRNCKNHPYATFWVVYGRKPYSTEAHTSQDASSFR